MTGDDDLILRRCQDFVRNIPENLNYITPPQLHERIATDPTSVFILDNRTPHAFAKGHIPGAVNIWIKDALNPENLARIPRDRQIVVCCWVGHTASQLLTVLQLLGYDAIGLKYGMGEPAVPTEPRLGWLDLSLPLERGPSSSAHD